MGCEIQLEGAQGSGPYTDDGRPSAITFLGRLTDTCGQVEITVERDGSVLHQATVTPDPPGGGTPERIFRTIMVVHPDADWHGGLVCCARVDLTATCLDDPACTDAGSFPIICKDAPPGLGDCGGPGGDGPDGGPDGGGPDGGGPDDGGPDDDDPDDDDNPWDWWPFPWPPDQHCQFARLAFVGVFVLALWAVVRGASSPQPGPVFLTAAALFATAGLMWVAWTGFAPFGLLVCNPDPCKRLVVLIWCFKWGVIGGLLIVLWGVIAYGAATGGPGVVVPVVYGVVTGWLVNRATASACKVPSARTLPWHLPY